MRVILFYRNPGIAHSIHRVFRTLVKAYKETSTDVIEFHMPFPGSKPLDVLRNCFYVRRNRDNHAIHHVTGHIHDVLLALVGFKTILTIHDLVFLDNVRNPLKRIYKWLFWFYIPIKISDRVVCISETTKSAILRRLNIDKVIVIHNPIDPIFGFVPREFNSEKPVILHIGTGWNKNLARTIEAIEEVSCHLRIIGRLSPTMVAKLSEAKVEYSNVSNLSDEEIVQEYINCDIVNFPSIYEGFGMPIIEGQKTGRVIIASRIEPLIEISGGGAVFVDPFCVSSIRAAYESVIHNLYIRERCIEEGLLNVQRFSVENISNQYLEVYKSFYDKD